MNGIGHRHHQRAATCHVRAALLLPWSLLPRRSDLTCDTGAWLLERAVQRSEEHCKGTFPRPHLFSKTLVPSRALRSMPSSTNRICESSHQSRCDGYIDTMEAATALANKGLSFRCAPFLCTTMCIYSKTVIGRSCIRTKARSYLYA